MGIWSRRLTARRISRRSLGRGLAAVLAAGAGAVPLRAAGAAGLTPGAQVDPLFRAFFERFGGMAVLGEPLTPRFEHAERAAQLFANFLLEYWPEHAGTPYEVQPGLLGTIVSGYRYFREIPPFHSSEEVVYVPQTRHSLRLGFLEFWRRHGGLELFGHPISEEVVDNGVTAQWFQRAKLTYDPTRSEPVRLDGLGYRYLDSLGDGIDASYEVDGTEPTEPGQAASISLTVTNRGTRTWPATGPEAVSLRLRWADSYKPTVRSAPGELALPRELGPGESTILQAEVATPPNPGKFRMQPDLWQQGEWFTSRAVAAPLVDTPAQLDTPEMRVGLLDISEDNPDAEQATVSSTGGMTVWDEGGVQLAELDAYRSITLQRDIPHELQVVTLPDGERILTVGKVAIRPQEASLLWLAETAPWHLYRGWMEFAWWPRFQSAWVVETLPMEDYLAGIAEQGDHIPWEALRASAITFRTYAYTTRRYRRTLDVLFDVAASTRHTPTLETRHQVYHGVARELSGTRLLEAAVDTRGLVMTYDGEPITAWYFSRADGQTRSAHEVWGGSPVPWAMSVPDPYSEGRTLWGHGVGLPLQSVNAMAATGANAEQILSSYYSGIEFDFVY